MSLVTSLALDSSPMEIEKSAGAVRNGQTNWYQEKAQPLGAPRDVKQSVLNVAGNRVVRLTWHTAFAANDPIEHYEILHDDRPVGNVRHMPQTTKEPFSFDDVYQEDASLDYRVVTVDRAGRRAVSEPPEEMPA